MLCEYEKEVSDMLSSANNKFPTIFVGHNFYEGSYNQYIGSEVLINPKAFSDYNAAFMGHLHGSRRVSKYCYTGSMEKNNFGDLTRKFLFIFDSNTNSVSKQKIPTRELLNMIVSWIQKHQQMPKPLY